MKLCHHEAKNQCVQKTNVFQQKQYNFSWADKNLGAKITVVTFKAY